MIVYNDLKFLHLGIECQGQPWIKLGRAEKLTWVGRGQCGLHGCGFSQRLEISAECLHFISFLFLFFFFIRAGDWTQGLAQTKHVLPLSCPFSLMRLLKRSFVHFYRWTHSHNLLNFYFEFFFKSLSYFDSFFSATFICLLNCFSHLLNVF
jgi:hypothetical protein